MLDPGETLEVGGNIGEGKMRGVGRKSQRSKLEIGE